MADTIDLIQITKEEYPFKYVNFGYYYKCQVNHFEFYFGTGIQRDYMPYSDIIRMVFETFFIIQSEYKPFDTQGELIDLLKSIHDNRMDRYGISCNFYDDYQVLKMYELNNIQIHEIMAEYASIDSDDMNDSDENDSDDEEEDSENDDDEDIGIDEHLYNMILTNTEWLTKININSGYTNSELIDKIKNMIFCNELTKCPICYELKKCMSFNCHPEHIICADCIEQLILSKQNFKIDCPICRTTMNLSIWNKFLDQLNDE